MDVINSQGLKGNALHDKGLEYNALQDCELLEKYLKGHFDAFEHLYFRHKGGTYRFIFRQVNNASVVEDLMQELWMKVISNARSYNKDSKFTTWLYQIARNLLIDRFRHLGVVSEVMVSEGIVSEEMDSEAMLSKSGRQDLTTVSAQKADTELKKTRQKIAIKDCLEKLPKVQLESFLLKEEAAMLQSEIAQVVGASLEATKSRLRVAYSSLRECLEKKLGERYDS